MQETQVQSLGQEDALEKDMAPHSSILAWEIPWTEEPGRLQSMQSQVRHDLVTKPPAPSSSWSSWKADGMGSRAPRAVSSSQPLRAHWRW